MRPLFAITSTRHYYDPENHELVPTEKLSKKPRPAALENPEVEIARLSEYEPQYSADNRNRQWILKKYQELKAIGYSSYVQCDEANDIFEEAHAQTIGTKEKELLCVTGDMGICHAIAVGGEKFDEGKKVEGAKVRIFHAYPENIGVEEDLRKRFRQFMSEGLTVKVAMHGGDFYDKKSKDMAAIIRAVLKEPEFIGKIHLEFDEMCDLRGQATILGAVVTKENEVKFVTELLGDDDPQDESASSPTLKRERDTVS